MTGALIGLARSVEGNEHLVNSNTYQLIVEVMFTTLTNVNFDDDAIRNQIALVHMEKARLIPNCGDCVSPCGKNTDYDMRLLWNADENIRSLKSLLNLGIRNIRLGPSMPAFLSKDVLAFLMENFGIAPITTPKNDLDTLLK